MKLTVSAYRNTVKLGREIDNPFSNEPIVELTPDEAESLAHQLIIWASSAREFSMPTCPECGGTNTEYDYGAAADGYWRIDCHDCDLNLPMATAPGSDDAKI